MNKAEQKYIDYCKNNYGLSVSEPTDDMLFKHLDKQLDTFLKDGYILLPDKSCMPITSIYKIGYSVYNMGKFIFQITFVDGNVGTYTDISCSTKDDMKQNIEYIANRIWGKSQIKTEFI